MIVWVCVVGHCRFSINDTSYTTHRVSPQVGLLSCILIYNLLDSTVSQARKTTCQGDGVEGTDDTYIYIYIYIYILSYVLKVLELRDL
jgi:hypothetical protein